MNCRRLLSILLVMLVAVSCDESTEIIRTQRNPVQKIQVTSLAKEPELERVLNVAGFYSAANGRTNDVGIEIDVDYVMKIVQSDSIHHTFTFKLEDQEDHSFSNLIIEELGDGYLGYILKYQYEEIYVGMEVFTGSIKRIDLAGELIRTMNFVNGDVIGITEMGSSNGRQRQQAPQCVVNSETFTECAVWGYTFAHQTEAVCLETVTVIVQELGDCPNADPFPSNPGPIPPAGGGTYIPTSGGSNPSPTPMDDPDVGNAVVPIKGYKRPVVVIEPEPDDVVDERMAEVMDSVYNHIQNPCLRNMVTKAVCENLDNAISHIINQVFENSELIDINFYESTTLDATILAQTYPETQTSGETERFLANVHLNANVLPNASQEIIVSTIMHEVLHAYMDYTRDPNLFNDHEEMASEYVELMTRALLNLFPDMSRSMAEALSWGGLQETKAWQDMDATKASGILKANRDHVSGEKGTKC